MSKAKALLVDVPLKAAGQWWNDDAMTLAAALAFYTIFSLAPLIIIALAVASFVVGEEAARGGLEAQMKLLIGSAGAQLVRDTLAGAARDNQNGRLATVIGILTLAVGSTGVFAQLQASLNAIWGVKAAPRSARTTVWQLIRIRLLSFGMVLVLGFLLLVSLVASAFMNAMHGRVDTYLMAHMPYLSMSWWYVNFFVSLGLAALLFMLLFRVLPDVRLTWSDVAIGALFTAVLFGIGKFLIGFYLGNSAVASTYGAAGSMVVVLIWVWFSGCILYYGAEFTQVYARNFGSHVEPAEIAKQVDEERAEPDEDIAEDAGIPLADPHPKTPPPRAQNPIARHRQQEKKDHKS
jgi:membrane protein